MIRCIRCRVRVYVEKGEGFIRHRPVKGIRGMTATEAICDGCAAGNALEARAS